MVPSGPCTATNVTLATGPYGWAVSGELPFANFVVYQPDGPLRLRLDQGHDADNGTYYDAAAANAGVLTAAYGGGNYVIGPNSGTGVTGVFKLTSDTAHQTYTLGTNGTVVNTSTAITATYTGVIVQVAGGGGGTLSVDNGQGNSASQWIGPGHFKRDCSTHPVRTYQLTDLLTDPPQLAFVSGRLANRQSNYLEDTYQINSDPRNPNMARSYGSNAALIAATPMPTSAEITAAMAMLTRQQDIVGGGSRNSSNQTSSTGQAADRQLQDFNRQQAGGNYNGRNGQPGFNGGGSYGQGQTQVDYDWDQLAANDAFREQLAAQTNFNCVRQYAPRYLPGTDKVYTPAMTQTLVNALGDTRETLRYRLQLRSNTQPSGAAATITFKANVQ